MRGRRLRKAVVILRDVGGWVENGKKRPTGVCLRLGRRKIAREKKCARKSRALWEMWGGQSAESGAHPVHPDENGSWHPRSGFPSVRVVR